MKAEIWMPWFVADYERDTKDLTIEEDCIYRRALDYLWQNPAGLPLVSFRLCLCLRIGEDVLKRTQWVLDRFLNVVDDAYRSKRIDLEKDKALKRQNIARQNGAFGGRPKKPTENPAGYPRGNPEHNPNHNPEKSSSPSPSPSQINTNTNTTPLPPMGGVGSENKKGVRIKKKLGPPTPECIEVFEYWKIKRGYPRAQLVADRQELIETRLADPLCSVERIKEAIDGIANSPHHMGHNDRKTVYDQIELICRTAANVEKFADMKRRDALPFQDDHESLSVTNFLNRRSQ